MTKNRSLFFEDVRELVFELERPILLLFDQVVDLLGLRLFPRPRDVDDADVRLEHEVLERLLDLRERPRRDRAEDVIRRRLELAVLAGVLADAIDLHRELPADVAHLLLDLLLERALELLELLIDVLHRSAVLIDSPREPLELGRDPIAVRVKKRDLRGDELSVALADLARTHPASVGADHRGTGT